MAFGDCYNFSSHFFCEMIMLPRFADIFQQGNRWLSWYHKQPEGSVRPAVIEAVTKIMACGTTLMGYTCWQCPDPGCGHSKKSVFAVKAAPATLRRKSRRSLDTVSSRPGARR
ncbi:Mobile element protein (plasmid) [Klebsiella sp. PL-2018]|nr:Mobile element protein [Klebsiella sp. PL-2018]